MRHCPSRSASANENLDHAMLRARHFYQRDPCFRARLPGSRITTARATPCAFEGRPHRERCQVHAKSTFLCGWAMMLVRCFVSTTTPRAPGFANCEHPFFTRCWSWRWRIWRFSPCAGEAFERAFLRSGIIVSIWRYEYHQDDRWMTWRGK